jgi:hypothetical protein
MKKSFKLKEIVLGLLFSLLFSFSGSVYASFVNITEKVPTKLIDFSEDSTVFNFDGSEEGIKINLERFDSKYLLLRTGVNLPRERSKILTTYFDKSVKEKTCSAIDLHDDFQIGNTYQVVNEKINSLRRCFKLRVSDAEDRDLKYLESQSNCQLENLSSSSVILAGGDCFINIEGNKNLTVEILPTKECSDTEFLKRNNINPTSFTTILQGYIYPTPELGSMFKPTEKLFEKRVFVNINPSNNLIKMGEQYTEEGQLYFRPDLWVIPDILISSLNLISIKDYTMVELGLLISTHSKKAKCLGGICSSYLNYDSPIAPELFIYEMPKNGEPSNKNLLATTYIGGRVPNRWQGEYFSKNIIKKFAFEKGKKYRFKLVFSDPHSDFANLSQSSKSSSRIRGIGTTGEESTFAGLRAGLDEVSGLGGLGGIGFIGGVPSLNGDIFGGLPEGVLDDVIPSMDFSFSDKTFPPMYSKACNKNLTCRSIGKKEHLVFHIDFKVEDIRGPKIITSKEFVVKRISELLPNYKKTITKKPRLKCK